MQPNDNSNDPGSFLDKQEGGRKEPTNVDVDDLIFGEPDEKDRKKKEEEDLYAELKLPVGYKEDDDEHLDSSLFNKPEGRLVFADDPGGNEFIDTNLTDKEKEKEEIINKIVDDAKKATRKAINDVGGAKIDTEKTYLSEIEKASGGELGYIAEKKLNMGEINLGLLGYQKDVISSLEKYRKKIASEDRKINDIFRKAEKFADEGVSESDFDRKDQITEEGWGRWKKRFFNKAFENDENRNKYLISTLKKMVHEQSEKIKKEVLQESNRDKNRDKKNIIGRERVESSGHVGLSGSVFEPGDIGTTILGMPENREEERKDEENLLEQIEKIEGNADVDDEKQGFDADTVERLGGYKTKEEVFLYFKGRADSRLDKIEKTGRKLDNNERMRLWNKEFLDEIEESYRSEEDKKLAREVTNDLCKRYVLQRMSGSKKPVEFRDDYVRSKHEVKEDKNEWYPELGGDEKSVGELDLDGGNQEKSQENALVNKLVEICSFEAGKALLSTFENSEEFGKKITEGFSESEVEDWKIAFAVWLNVIKTGSITIEGVDPKEINDEVSRVVLEKGDLGALSYSRRVNEAEDAKDAELDEKLEDLKKKGGEKWIVKAYNSIVGFLSFLNPFKKRVVDEVSEEKDAVEEKPQKNIADKKEDQKTVKKDMGDVYNEIERTYKTTHVPLEFVNRMKEHMDRRHPQPSKEEHPHDEDEDDEQLINSGGKKAGTLNF